MLCDISERKHSSEEVMCILVEFIPLCVHAQKSRGENSKQVLIKDILISVVI